MERWLKYGVKLEISALSKSFCIAVELTFVLYNGGLENISIYAKTYVEVKGRTSMIYERSHA